MTPLPPLFIIAGSYARIMHAELRMRNSYFGTSVNFPRKYLKLPKSANRVDVHLNLSLAPIGSWSTSLSNPTGRSRKLCLRV